MPAVPIWVTNPYRLAIIEFLKDGKKIVMAIAKAIDVRQPNTSRHLAYMKKRGIVQTRKASTSTHYRLASPKIAEASYLLKELVNEQLSQRKQKQKLVMKEGFPNDSRAHA